MKKWQEIWKNPITNKLFFFNSKNGSFLWKFFPICHGLAALLFYIVGKFEFVDFMKEGKGVEEEVEYKKFLKIL